MNRILVKDGVTYSLHSYVNENELQNYVAQHSQYIFGENSVIFEGERIGASRGESGAKGIPDFFAIDFSTGAWYVIEVELGRHNPYEHILPQIHRFSQAIKDKKTLDRLKVSFDTAIRCNNASMLKFRNARAGDEIFKFLHDTLETKPILLIIADFITEEITQACEELLFQKEFIAFETFLQVEADLKSPIFHVNKLSSGMTTHTVNVPLRSIKNNQIIKPIYRGGGRTLKFLGISVGFRHVKEIFPTVANELIKRGALKESMIPWGPGRRRYYVSKEPHHPTGLEFQSPIQLDNGWFAETNMSEGNSVTNSERLIELCGIGDNRVILE